MTKRVLGRGLEALLSATEGTETASVTAVDEVPVDRIIPNDSQPEDGLILIGSPTLPSRSV